MAVQLINLFAAQGIALPAPVGHRLPDDSDDQLRKA
jgi:hypothetical protein